MKPTPKQSTLAINQKIEPKRGQPDPTGPLLNIPACAKMAGVPELAYRRTLRRAKGHPMPITDGRPELFRRIEIQRWLGIYSD